MKILQINQSDIGGGAGIAGYRLHQGLLNQGIDSKLLVGFIKTTVLLTFGSGGETITSQLGIPTLSLGYISSDRPGAGARG